MVKSAQNDSELVNGSFAGGSRRAADLARSMPAQRASHPSTSRARISAAKPKRGRLQPLGPTPERLAKGDIDPTTGGFHRSIPPVERLRDQEKLDRLPHMNQAVFEAVAKLRRHFDGCLVGVKAQDLNKVVGGATEGLTQEEGWVHHFDTFRKACKLMGWSDANPHRGAGRLVVAVVCYEQTIRDAATVHTGIGRIESAQIAGLDRLREGLYALAVHWRFC